MGREALAHVEIGMEAGEARVLLESTEIILRGQVRRRFARDRIEELRVGDGTLAFCCDGENVLLHLGKSAETWARAIATPPPSLRAKLGLADGARACVIGLIDDDAVAEAVAASTVDDPASAQLIVALIAGPADVEAALAASAAGRGLPVWMVYGKGRTVTYGDAAVRSAMRAAGFRDTKSCAVSERLTATRYNPAADGGGADHAGGLLAG